MVEAAGGIDVLGVRLPLQTDFGRHARGYRRPATSLALVVRPGAAVTRRMVHIENPGRTCSCTQPWRVFLRRSSSGTIPLNIPALGDPVSITHPQPVSYSTAQPPRTSASASPTHAHA
jgi:hypothetical protein